jgi:flagellar L-ring protein precursor FlgH
MKMFRSGSRLALVILAAVLSMPAAAESLWSPEFDGYLTTRTRLQEGDIVLVTIDASSSLTFNSASSDSRSLTLEFSGGEFGDLFSFLPAGSTGGQSSARGEQRYELSTQVAARISRIDDGGRAFVEGSRAFDLDAKEESLTVSGWLDPAALEAGGSVPFSRLADARLRFRTFLQPAAPTLSAADIELVAQALQAPAAAAAGAGAAPAPAAAPAVPAPTAGAAAAAAAQPQPTPQRMVRQLSEERKVALFLAYINRLIDLLFR